MLTGAARRGAASCGSLLIAAVPSSPIESDGFPTSSWCGRVGGVGRAGGRWLGQARLACLLLGLVLGGAASHGCFRRTRVQTGVSLAVCVAFDGSGIRNLQRRSACMSSDLV